MNINDKNGILNQTYVIITSEIFKQYNDLCNKTKNNLNFEEFFQNEELLCQFILDPTSLKLPVRVSLYDPVVNDFYKLSRDLCFLIDKKRKKLLKEL